MIITKKMAESCVSYLQKKGYSAYTYQHNNILSVYIAIDNIDLELSANEIINRYALFLEELLEIE